MFQNFTNSKWYYVSSHIISIPTNNVWSNYKLLDMVDNAIGLLTPIINVYSPGVNCYGFGSLFVTKLDMYHEWSIFEEGWKSFEGFQKEISERYWCMLLYKSPKYK